MAKERCGGQQEESKESTVAGCAVQVEKWLGTLCFRTKESLLICGKILWPYHGGVGSVLPTTARHSAAEARHSRGYFVGLKRSLVLKHNHGAVIRTIQLRVSV